jgi:uncharacterized membrane protein
MENNRLHLLDTIRGITVISMVFYHALWNLVYMHGVKISWFLGDLGAFWQQSICCTFIFLSDFCRGLGSKHLKRGLLVFGGGLIVTAATFVIMPNYPIIFGILTFLGTAMLILIPFEKILLKIPHAVGAAVFFVLFLLFKNCNLGFLGFGELNLIKLPDFLYSNYLTAFLGFPKATFVSSDYFSLFPWLFLFICGFYFCQIFKSNDLLKHLKSKPVFLLGFIGKNSFVIYLAHQPILYLVFSLIF